MNIKDAMICARKIALRGKGKVEPNPMVGAVLVLDGKIVAEAFHEKFGGAHAEVLAIESAKKKGVDFKKCTLVVTLEPCVSFLGKKTGSCAELIVESGIPHVVCDVLDINPLVHGCGIELMKNAGVKVEVLSVRAEKPLVTMKIAMSLDGKIATRTGDSKWITGAPAREFVHTLRDSFDAILVGINTVLADDPTLAGAHSEPLRIVLDSHLRVTEKYKVLRDKNVVIVTTNLAPKNKLSSLQKDGIKILNLGEKISISPLLRFLAQSGVKNLLVEGGAEVFGSFIDAKCVDKFYWFVSPKIIGGRDAKTAIGGEGIKMMKDALTIKKLKVKKLGDDFLFISMS
jgi:diaminohydroxyphosphoribosylaminopyrimidine deaminase/5-amino-6-(5-phosphoribosylamino)uracil reductase